MKFYTFLHTQSEITQKKQSDIVLQAYENKYAYMQYEYDIQHNPSVSTHWNKVKNIKIDDVVFLRDKSKIYAWGYAIAPRLDNDKLERVELNCQDIIDYNEHGKYRSDKYKGYVTFDDCEVFYENLEEGKNQWGQRVDVKKWLDYNKNGIDYIPVLGRGLVKKCFNKKQAEKYVRKLSGDKYFTFEDFFEDNDAAYVEKVNEVKESKLNEDMLRDAYKNPIEALSTETKGYSKNPVYGKAAIKRAKYLCENDKKHPTFTSSVTGKPFMEAHHLIPMHCAGYIWKTFKVNIDCPENIVSFCPNCHRQIHYAAAEEKSALIEKMYQQKKDELVKIGIVITLEELKGFYQ